MDDRTTQQRSATMAAVKSQNTRLEREFLDEISRDIRRKLNLHPTDLPGRPDFVHRRSKVAIFIDSCFWHGCHLHLRMPTANRTYWFAKISRNRHRDSRVNKELRKSGWLVMRIWEHSLTNPRARKWWHTRIVNQIK